jgi:hypothetical protein
MAGTLGEAIETAAGNLQPKYGGRDAFLVVVSTTGRPLRSALIGSAGSDAINEVVAGPRDAIGVVGPFGQRGQTALHFPDGTEAPFVGGDQDVFVATFDSAGAFVWGRGVWGDADIFVAVYEADGQVRWSRSFGGRRFDACRGIDPGRAGEIVISGEFTGDISFDRFDGHGDEQYRNVFVARLDEASGAVVGLATLSSDGDSIGCEIEVEPDGTTWCSGSAAGVLRYPGGMLPGSAAGAQFLVRLSPDLSEGQTILSLGIGRALNFEVVPIVWTRMGLC